MVRLTDILSEVGDAGKPLAWKVYKHTDSWTLYSAQSSKDPKVQYKISIVGRGVWEIIFNAVGSNSDHLTNLGEPLRIIATVVECVEHHFKKFILPKIGRVDFEGYEFSGQPKASDAERGATSRTRVYKMFVSKSPLVKKYFDIIAAGNMVQLLLKDQYMK